MTPLNRIVRAALAGMTVLAVGGGVQSAIAVQLPNGQTAFTQSPRLIQTTTTNAVIDAPAIYRFTITLPEGAGEPLKAIRIEQRKNVETIQFQEQSSQAFEGVQAHRESEVSLSAVGGRSEPGAVTVVFDKPIQPGNTITLSVTPQRNPSTSNIYQFGITAFPAGEDARGQFLGYGQISIYSAQ